MQISSSINHLTEIYPPEFPPKWASNWGEDHYGLFAEMMINEDKQLSQCFRWIAAGEFMMGSPKTEKERRGEAEDLHVVTLSHGYWLADTTVTQALWQVIMGENPAYFKADNNPVEQVSWDDAQKFIKKLSTLLADSLGDLTLGLPTEAQWEHACRAGTQTPFSFGENITSEQVNYIGSIFYANGQESEYRAKTVAVKSLPVNPWGLYEMHGNVWEWCTDAWQAQLGEQAVSDPYQQEQRATDRVMRGGSWFNDGERVRSAYRYRRSAGNRDNGIGFRLSLGLVSYSRGSEKKEEQSDIVQSQSRRDEDEAIDSGEGQIAEIETKKSISAKIKGFFKS